MFGSKLFLFLMHAYNEILVRDISGGIATGFGLHGPGIESWWDEIVCKRPERP
jgi:hypothetical protein